MTPKSLEAILSLMEEGMTETDRAEIFQKLGFGKKMKVLKRREVCEILGISLPTLRTYEKAGLLKVVKYSARKHRFNASDVEIFMTLGAAAMQQK